MLDNLRNDDPFVLKVLRAQAHAADSHGRKFGPAYRPFEQLRGLDARENDAIGAAVQGARDQRILHVGDAYDRRQPGQARGVAQIEQRFDPEISVFGIDERPMKAGGGQNLGYFHRADLAESAAELQFALLQGGLHVIYAHKFKWSGRDGRDSPGAPRRRFCRSAPDRVWPETAGWNKSAPANG